MNEKKEWTEDTLKKSKNMWFWLFLFLIASFFIGQLVMEWRKPDTAVSASTLFVPKIESWRKIATRPNPKDHPDAKIFTTFHQDPSAEGRIGIVQWRKDTGAPTMFLKSWNLIEAAPGSGKYITDSQRTALFSGGYWYIGYQGEAVEARKTESTDGNKKFIRFTMRRSEQPKSKNMITLAIEITE